MTSCDRIWKRGVTLKVKCFITLVLIVTSVVSTMTAAAETELTVLLWPAEPGEQTAVKQVFGTFEEVAGDIQLDLVETSGDYFEQVKVMMASDAPLDVVTIYPFAAGEWVANDLFVDLRPFIDRDDINIEELFPQPIIENFSYEGKIWGMPTDAGIIPVFYNETPFGESGLLTPDKLQEDSTWNWDTFLDAARKLTRDSDGDGNLDQFGVDYYVDLSRYIHWVWNNGGQLFDRKVLPTRTTFSDPKSVEAIQFFLDLRLKYGVVGGNFLNGNSAMQLNQGPWYVNRALETGYPIGIVPQPAKERQTTSIWANGYQIVKGSDQVEAAWRFLKYITLDENTVFAYYKATGRTPVLTTVYGTREILTPPPKNRRFFQEGLYTGELPPVSPVMHQIRTDITPRHINRVLAGEVPVRTAAKMIDEEATALLSGAR